MPDDRVSFTRGLFAGDIAAELLFPYPAPLDNTNPDEARTVRRLIAALDTRLDGLIDSAKFDAEETIGDDVIAALAEHGFLGLNIPKRFGGLELSPTGYARVFEEISAVDASLGVFIGVHCGLGSKAIVLYGNEAQQAKYLPKLARGEMLAAYALTEPLVGSDAQHVKSMATRSNDGSTWYITGEKLWIGLAHRAGVITTFAQTEVERDGKRVLRPTAFLVEPSMPGFRVVQTIRKMGIRGSTQAQLEYTNVPVPASQVLGEVGKGFQVAVHVLNGGRLTLTAGCTGGAKRLVGEMTRYASERVQFDHPLADFEITQRKISSIAAEVYAADAMVGVLAKLATEDTTDWSLEAAIGKVFASELVWRASDEMVQIAGGRGFVLPYPYERYLRDARINRIFEGANEILRLFIALNGIQEPSEHLKEVAAAVREPMRNLGILSEYVAGRVKDVFGATSASLGIELHPVLKANQSYFEKHVGELQSATERAVMQYRAQIIDRQMIVERLANMAIELFATACVLSRTQALLNAHGLEACERELLLCNLFCVEAGRRFRSAREALRGQVDEIDATRRDAAAAVRAAGGYFVRDAILGEE